MLGKAIALGLLGIEHLSIHFHVKDAPPALNQLGLDPERTINGIRQTGGMGKIISLSTVLDADLHSVDPENTGYEIHKLFSILATPRRSVNRILPCSPLPDPHGHAILIGLAVLHHAQNFLLLCLAQLLLPAITSLFGIAKYREIAVDKALSPRPSR